MKFLETAWNDVLHAGLSAGEFRQFRAPLGACRSNVSAGNVQRHWNARDLTVQFHEKRVCLL